MTLVLIAKHKQMGPVVRGPYIFLIIESQDRLWSVWTVIFIVLHILVTIYDTHNSSFMLIIKKKKKLEFYVVINVWTGSHSLLVQFPEYGVNEKNECHTHSFLGVYMMDDMDIEFIDLLNAFKWNN